MTARDADRRIETPRLLMRPPVAGDLAALAALWAQPQVTAFISGAPFRLGPVARALERIAAADGVWLTTPREIHRAVVASPQLFPTPVGAMR